MPQTIMALSAFLLATILMGIAQIYSDSLPEYPDECKQLQDLGFKVFPYLGSSVMNATFWVSVSSVWIVASVVVFVITAIVLSLTPPRNGGLMVRRFFWIMSVLYLTRTIALLLTRYPGLLSAEERYVPDNWLGGSILILLSIHATGSDMMFSGHTALWVVMSLSIARYTNYSSFSMLYWISSVLGIMSIVVTRFHYSADIFIGFVISKLVFTCYHLFFDSLYMRYWVPGVAIVDPSGANSVVGPDGKLHPTAVSGITSKRMTAWYEWLVWLDAQ